MSQGGEQIIWLTLCCLVLVQCGTCDKLDAINGTLQRIEQKMPGR